MKKFIALFLIVALLSLVGCKKTENNNSSDIDTNSSEIISSTDENSTNTEVSSDEITSSETVTEVSSSQTSTPSKSESSLISTASTPTTSNTTETNSSNELTENTLTTNSDCISNTTPYKTVTLYKKTTYCGFVGYFCNLQSTVALPKILGLDEDTLMCKGITEFHNIEDGSPIWFVSTSAQKAVMILPERIEEEKNVFRFSVPANVIWTKTDAFEYFDEPLNEYMFSEPSGEKIDSVKICTTVDDVKYETEIYSIFQQHFGYSTDVPIDTNCYGAYYVDDSGKPCNIYHYMLTVSNTDN